MVWFWISHKWTFGWMKEHLIVRVTSRRLILSITIRHFRPKWKPLLQVSIVLFSTNRWWWFDHNVNRRWCYIYVKGVEFFSVCLNTGWPKSKFPFSKTHNSESIHIWPQVGKAKIGLRGGSFFSALADFLPMQNELT